MLSSPAAVRSRDRVHPVYRRFEGVYSLNKVAITGGPAVTLGRPGGTAVGASWGPDGTIIFATNVRTTGLLRIADGGSEPTAC